MTWTNQKYVETHDLDLYPIIIFLCPFGGWDLVFPLGHNPVVRHATSQAFHSLFCIFYVKYYIVSKGSFHLVLALWSKILVFIISYNWKFSSPFAWLWLSATKGRTTQHKNKSPARKLTQEEVKQLILQTNFFI